MKKIIVVLLFSISNAIFAQSINDYKYASLPDKFEIMKKKKMPRLNTLIKMHMQKYGYETYFDSEPKPLDFTNTNCNKVFVDLVEENTLFATKVAVILKDCKGTVLATSPMGISREKDLNVAYDFAIREAFANFTALKNYKYNGKIVVENLPITVVKSPENGLVQPNSTPISDIQTTTSGQLYAQAIPNGFQLVNSEPRIIMKLFKTSAKDVFTAVKGNLQGVLVTKNNEWFFEYYQNDQLISEKVDVKF